MDRYCEYKDAETSDTIKVVYEYYGCFHHYCPYAHLKLCQVLELLYARLKLFQAL